MNKDPIDPDVNARYVEALLAMADAFMALSAKMKRAHFQRMIYAVYFAPRRSSN